MWIAYAMGTVLCWGLYGAMLNKGATNFEHDRMKAFFFVGIAYFLVAIIGPYAVLLVTGKTEGLFSKPEGMKWSLIAGILGAIGALTALFALSNNPLKGPAAASQVMSLIFAGAPIVAAAYGYLNRAKDVTFPWQFILGLAMAATGGALVTLYKPA